MASCSGSARAPLFFISAINLGFQWPDGTDVFRSLNFSISRKKIGLTGGNGAGKSTLLALIAGRLEPSSGVLRRRGRFGVLFQDRSGPNELRSPASRSGGERLRARISEILEHQPDVLALDEPTNDLDREGRDMILGLVSRFDGPVLVISHDPEVLARVDEIWELDSRGLRVYGGSWDFYRRQREAERTALLLQHERTSHELSRTRERVRESRERQERNQSRGRKKAFAKGVDKMTRGNLERRGQATAGRLKKQGSKRVAEVEARAARARELAPEVHEIHLDVPPTEVPQGKSVLEIEGLRLAPDSGARPLWNTGLDLRIVGPKRVLITGPNGSGKSTLLRAIAGDPEILVHEGRLKSVERMARLDQATERLDPNLSALDCLRGVAPGLSESEARVLLGRIRIHGTAALRPSAHLSGGERMRAALLMCLRAEPSPSLLLLDEPTNNLDIESRSLFAAALATYRGAILAVSHDTAFISDVGFDEIWWLDRNGLQQIRTPCDSEVPKA